ncbi:MAG: hypothetical protein ACPG4T_20245, partial [Nannocystaceae bacterium]
THSLTGFARVGAVQNGKISFVKCSENACFFQPENCAGDGFSASVLFAPNDVSTYFPTLDLGECVFYSIEANRPSVDPNLCTGSSLVLREPLAMEDSGLIFVGVHSQVAAPVEGMPQVDVASMSQESCPCEGDCCEMLGLPIGKHYLSFEGAIQPPLMLTEGSAMEASIGGDAVAVKNFSSTIPMSCDAPPSFAWAVTRK